MPSARASRSEWFVIAAALTLSTLVALSFAGAVLSPIGPDEGMYLGASYLARESGVYAEFSYYQTPYLPLLMAKLFGLFEPTSPLLVGRLVTWFHHGATLVLFLLILLRQTQDRVFSLIGVWVLSLNGHVFHAPESLHNATFAMTYAALGYYFLLTALARDGSLWRAGAGGFFLMVSVGFKLTYAPVVAAAGAVLVLHGWLGRGPVSNPWGRIAAFGLGIVLGAAPLLSIVGASFDEFLFNNVIWHVRQAELTADLTQTGPVVSTLETGSFYLRIGWAGGALLFGLLMLAMLGTGRDRESDRRVGLDQLLPASIALASFLSVFLTGRVYWWYPQPVVVYGTLFAASLYPCLSASAKRNLCILTLPLLVYLAAIRRLDLRDALHVLQTERWTSSRHQTLAARIGRDASRGDRGNVIAVGNTAVVLAIESRMSLSPTCATSAFLDMNTLMDMEDAEELGAKYHLGTYPGYLERIGRRDPALVLLSPPWQDRSFEESAVERGLPEGVHLDLLDSLGIGYGQPLELDDGSQSILVFRALPEAGYRIHDSRSAGRSIGFPFR